VRPAELSYDSVPHVGARMKPKLQKVCQIRGRQLPYYELTGQLLGGPFVSGVMQPKLVLFRVIQFISFILCCLAGLQKMISSFVTKSIF
jgi:hypothetical protein